ncbi:MAG: M24 family metallopeptidase [Ilumatobacteraceae bacterium]
MTTCSAWPTPTRRSPTTAGKPAQQRVTEAAFMVVLKSCTASPTTHSSPAATCRVARGARYGLLADHGGHGIGRKMHEEPGVPNEGPAGKGMRLEAGLVLALEPMQ